MNARTGHFSAQNARNDRALGAYTLYTHTRKNFEEEPSARLGPGEASRASSQQMEKLQQQQRPHWNAAACTLPARRRSAKGRRAKNGRKRSAKARWKSARAEAKLPPRQHVASAEHCAGEPERKCTRTTARNSHVTQSPPITGCRGKHAPFFSCSFRLFLPV